MSADAASSGASITSVQFFDGSTSLGSVSLAPYNVSVSGLSTGSHVITAVATDSNGLSTTSPSVTINITADGTNAPPPAPLALSAGTGCGAKCGPDLDATGHGHDQFDHRANHQLPMRRGDGQQCPGACRRGRRRPLCGSNFNLIGQLGTNGTIYRNVLNNAGTTIPTLAINLQVGGSSATNATENMTGTAVKLFDQQVYTLGNTDGRHWDQ